MERLLAIGAALVLLASAPLCRGQQDTAAESGMTEAEVRIRKLLGLPLGAEGPEPAAIDRAAAREILRGIRQEMFPQYRWLALHTVQAGGGYQRNPLRKPAAAEDAAFLTASIESSITRLRNESPVASLYALAERREYGGSSDLPAESLVLLFGSSTIGGNPRRLLSAEASALHARQVLEDPLQQGAASLLELWNASLRAGLLLSRGNHTVFTGLAGVRERYRLEDLDSASAGPAVRWEWAPAKHLELATALEYARQTYEDRLARLASGAPVADQRLKLDRVSLSTRVRWKPDLPWVKWCDTAIRLRRDWSARSAYDTSVFLQAIHSTEFSWNAFTLRPAVEASYRAYDDRLARPGKPGTQWRRAVVLSCSVEYAFSTATRAGARYVFDYARSNRDVLSYQSDGLHLHLSHSF